MCIGTGTYNPPGRLGQRLPHPSTPSHAHEGPGGCPGPVWTACGLSGTCQGMNGRSSLFATGSFRFLALRERPVQCCAGVLLADLGTA